MFAGVSLTGGWQRMAFARMTWVRRQLWQCIALALCAVCFGLTLEELTADPKLTPQKFASYFSDFTFKFYDEVQPVAVFLTTRRGDCDDYATLAADVLRAKGYTPRLVSIRMPGLTHVVCYIEETKNYLDFNNRTYLKKTENCGPSLPEIAKKVAKSFDASWTSASEFTYQNGVKTMVNTVAKTATK